MIHLTWESSHIKGDFFHIARRHMSGKNPCRLHTHEFAEVFWIDEGRGTHFINGKEMPLAAGDMVTIRPSDCHDFVPIDEKGFGVVNVAFPVDTLSFLREHYFPNQDRFFWATTELPFQLILSISQIRWMKGWAEHLARTEKTRLEVERFLLNVLYELNERCKLDPGDTVPAWLREALEKIREPEHFTRGTPELARLACRCPEHVTRELKKHLNMTATDVLNQARMEYAAVQLKMTDKEIIQISFDCGFQNLGHFYQVFRNHWSTTPNSYRQYHKAAIPQAVR